MANDGVILLSFLILAGSAIAYFTFSSQEKAQNAPDSKEAPFGEGSEIRTCSCLTKTRNTR